MIAQHRLHGYGGWTPLDRRGPTVDHAIREEHAMARQIRRVITGHDATGKAVVMADGPAPNVRVRPVMGTASTLLWVTDATPADISSSADTAAREIGVAPPAGGSILRIVEFPAKAQGADAVDN